MSEPTDETPTSPQAFQVVEALEEPKTGQLPDKPQEFFQKFITKHPSPSIYDIWVDAVRPSPGVVIQERSDLQSSLDDNQKEHYKEQRAFYLKLLSVADSLDRLMKQLESSSEMFSHINSVRNKLFQVLEEVDIEPIPVSPGQPFDPTYSDVSDRQVREDLAADTIISVESRGYTWQSKVLRPVRVIISIKPQGG